MAKFQPASGNLLQAVSLFLFSFIGSVPFHVSLQMARSCAGIVALFAGERFLASVGEHVRL